MPALYRLPPLLLLLGLLSISTLVPAIIALRQDAFHDARSFFYSGIVGLILMGLLAIATANRPASRNPMRPMLDLLSVFVLLPFALAVPFYEAVQTTTFFNAWLEMVSCLTTTGLPIFDPERLSGAEHLWRAQVGWFGGLIIWVAAAAILAPLTLGGFEVIARGEPGQSATARLDGAQRQSFDPSERILRSARMLVPVYAGLTLVLWTTLAIAGESPLVALVHAMSVMATSGISAVGGLENAAAGIPGEMLVALFLCFALSRKTFTRDTTNSDGRSVLSDPEFRLGLILVSGVTALLFLRHWAAAFDVDREQDFLAGLSALWGAAFTVLSFLTTTGFVSVAWEAAQGWSGLETPGLILMGLAVMGGGVATTAGGVKLLRVFALYLNGQREIERLVHPSSVAGQGPLGRRVRKEGAFIAWIFFMLFAVTIAVLTLLFAAIGVPFDESVLMSVTSLTNTGPLFSVTSIASFDTLGLADAAKVVLALGMILGRLELLALIILLSPDLWRD